MLVAVSAGLISLGLVGSADAALVSRLGGLAYYDDVANLTWLADANYVKTSGYDADGRMNWADVNAWAAGLTIGGVGGWRLPDTLQPDASCDYQSGGDSSGYNCTGSEMGNLFYNVLGGSAGSSITTTHNANYDLFSNVQSSTYWSATESAPDPYDAWGFNMGYGVQGRDYKTYGNYAWAVQSGDVSEVVPVPAAVWLFGSGLMGLAGFARRKKA